MVINAWPAFVVAWIAMWIHGNCFSTEFSEWAERPLWFHERCFVRGVVLNISDAAEPPRVTFGDRTAYWFRHDLGVGGLFFHGVEIFVLVVGQMWHTLRTPIAHHLMGSYCDKLRQCTGRDTTWALR